MPAFVLAVLQVPYSHVPNAVSTAWNGAMALLGCAAHGLSTEVLPQVQLLAPLLLAMVCLVGLLQL